MNKHVNSRLPDIDLSSPDCVTVKDIQYNPKPRTGQGLVVIRYIAEIEPEDLTFSLVFKPDYSGSLFVNDGEIQFHSPNQAESLLQSLFNIFSSGTAIANGSKTQTFMGVTDEKYLIWDSGEVTVNYSQPVFEVFDIYNWYDAFRKSDFEIDTSEFIGSVSVPSDPKISTFAAIFDSDEGSLVQVYAGGITWHKKDSTLDIPIPNQEFAIESIVYLLENGAEEKQFNSEFESYILSYSI